MLANTLIKSPTQDFWRVVTGSNRQPQSVPEREAATCSLPNEVMVVGIVIALNEKKRKHSKLTKEWLLKRDQIFPTNVMKDLLYMLPLRDMSMYDTWRLMLVQTFIHGPEPSKLHPRRSGQIGHLSNTWLQQVYPFHMFKNTLKHHIVKRVGQHVWPHKTPFTFHTLSNHLNPLFTLIHLQNLPHCPQSSLIYAFSWSINAENTSLSSSTVNIVNVALWWTSSVIRLTYHTVYPN